MLSIYTEALKRTMEHEHKSKNVLCLNCGEILPRSNVEIICPQCSTSFNANDFDDLSNYATEAYYYGYQYRVYYERAYQLSSSPAKPCLGFAGEAFTWVMLAMLSGIIGNATHDVVKKIIADLREQSRMRCTEDKSYDALLNVTDEEIEEIFQYARDYYNGMKSIQKEVRAAIIEEIMADEIAHDPVIGLELMKLIERENLKPKHRRKAQELYRIAISRAMNRKPPSKERFLGLWSSHPPKRKN